VRNAKDASRAPLLLLLLCAACASTGGDEEPEPLAEIPSWPRQYATGGGERLVVYQPQIIEWEKHERAEARAALSFERAAGRGTALGTMRFQAKTQVDLERRRVKVSDLELLEIRFPTLDTEQEMGIAARIEADVLSNDMVTTLDHFVAGVERSRRELVEVPIKTDAPPIFVSTEPALLLQFDGQAVFAPVVPGKDESDRGLRYALNTNWDVIADGDGTLYLLVEDAWLTAPVVAGPWKPAATLPEAFSALPDDDNWKHVREHLPGRALELDAVPRIFVSERPAELILIDGEPKLEEIPGTQLLDVVNTESDLLLSLSDGRYYYLVSGRWFRASDLAGPWSFATPDLPRDFAKIPADHPRASVRALVPGTPEAEEAVILSQIPQKATVERDAAKPTVQYAGDPEFVPIEGTALAYARNTSSDVIRLGDLYYLCFQGVWFVSASPSGPWETADSIPSEIYEIPPSSPVHHVTYVRVYETTPTTVVVGYTPGYMGMYYSYGCVMWGTGWYYPSYYYWPPYYGYPYYYRYPASYGFSSWYNPATGFYGRGAVAYGPYGGIGRGAAYNPVTGTYARGGAAWGPYQSGAWARAYNPRTGAYGATRQGADAYSSWGRSVIGKGDDWVRTGHYSDSRGTIAGYQTSRGGAGIVARGDEGGGFVGRTPEGDLYAGKDGNVYRRGEDGGWERHGSDGWSPVSDAERDAARERAQERAGSVDRDAARQRVQERDGATGREAARERVQSGDRSTDRARTRDSERRTSAGTRSRSTTGQLERDRRGRVEGQRRHDRYQTYNRGSRGSYGGARGGGGRRR
jgi:hypothetical protein